MKKEECMENEVDFKAYDFMVMFCALNVKNNNFTFNKEDLLDFIRVSKENGEYQNILNDIHFKNNGIFYYSKEIDEALSILVWSQSIYYILNESIPTTYINRDIAIDEILNKREEYIPYMEEFMEKYNNYLYNIEDVVKKVKK